MKAGNKVTEGGAGKERRRRKRGVPELDSAQQFPSLGTSGAAAPPKVEVPDPPVKHNEDVDEEEKERIRLAKKAFYKKKKKERAQRKKALRAQEVASQESKVEEKKQTDERPVQHVEQQKPPQPVTTTIAPAAKPVVRVKKVKTTLGELMATGVPGKLEKKAGTKKKKKTSQIVTLPMYDEEGNRIVVLGRKAKTNGILLRRRAKWPRVSSMKKALFRARVRAAFQNTTRTSTKGTESASQVLSEFMLASRGMSQKERKRQAAALPPLQCHWGSCTASFGNTRAALEEFRAHLESHARQQAQFVFWSSSSPFNSTPKSRVVLLFFSFQG